MSRIGRILVVSAVTAAVAALVLVVTNRKPSNVVRVNKAEARLQEAVRKAQAGLDSFITRLSKAKEGSRFAVKGTFPTQLGPEYLWVRDPIYRQGVFEGVLDQDPLVYRLNRKGDVVRIARGQVVDTLILEDGKREGAYTDDALSGN